MSDVGSKDQITKPSFDEELERLSEHFDDEHFPDYRDIKIADVSKKESDFENQELPSHECVLQSRERKLTEKGKAYHLETLNRKRQSAYKDLLKQINKIRQSLETIVNSETLEAERCELDKLKEAFNDAHKAFDDELETETGKQSSYHWFDVRDREYMECRIKVTERIYALEKGSHRTKSERSGYSDRSKRSALTQGSRPRSVRSMRLEAAAKGARLKTEMEFLDSENELRRLQLIKEIVIADAEESAMKTILDEEKGESKIERENKFKMDAHPPQFILKAEPAKHEKLTFQIRTEATL